MKKLFLLHQHQATRRHSVAWQDSLRYRHPDLDRMPGLRRITICKNPLINDRGAELIAEALKDDLWVKGVFFVCFVLFCFLFFHYISCKKGIKVLRSSFKLSLIFFFASFLELFLLKI